MASEQPSWTAESDPVQERFRAFVMKLGEDRGFGWGWKRDVSKTIDVRPDHLSRVINRTRRVSFETMQRAALLTGTPPVFTHAEAQWSPPPTPPIASGRGELAVMADLESLDSGARSRVLAWAAARWPS